MNWCRRICSSENKKSSDLYTRRVCGIKWFLLKVTKIVNIKEHDLTSTWNRQMIGHNFVFFYLFVIIFFHLLFVLSVCLSTNWRQLYDIVCLRQLNSIEKDCICCWFFVCLFFLSFALPSLDWLHLCLTCGCCLFGFLLSLSLSFRHSFVLIWWLPLLVCEKGENRKSKSKPNTYGFESTYAYSIMIINEI